MDDDEDDDFMCILVGGGKTIAMCKGVTVVASKLKSKSEHNETETVKFSSMWRRLIARFINSKPD